LTQLSPAPIWTISAPDASGTIDYGGGLTINFFSFGNLIGAGNDILDASGVGAGTPISFSYTLNDPLNPDRTVPPIGIKGFASLIGGAANQANVGLVGDNVSPTTWNITNTDAGTVQFGAATPIPFSGVGNITGGSGNDTFNFLVTPTIGSLDGVSGLNG